MPMMITRLMLSLKKAASTPRWVSSSIHPSWAADNARYAERTVGGTECVRDAAPLRTETAKFSHRVIGGTEYRGDIELEVISP